MPTYEYRCERCGHVFERFQAMTAAPLATCPQCKGPVKRVIGAGAAILMKGSGSRATDGGRSTSPACGRDAPCCGREIPCDTKPCET